MSSPQSIYSDAVGWTVIAISESDDPDIGSFPQLICSRGTQYTVLEISCDEEGNGPGYIFGLDAIHLDLAREWRTALAAQGALLDWYSLGIPKPVLPEDRYYHRALGLTITGVSESKDHFPQLICSRGNGNRTQTMVLEISYDEEGSRPGHIFGLEMPL